MIRQLAVEAEASRMCRKWTSCVDLLVFSVLLSNMGAIRRDLTVEEGDPTTVRKVFCVV